MRRVRLWADGRRLCSSETPRQTLKCRGITCGKPKPSSAGDPEGLGTSQLRVFPPKGPGRRELTLTSQDLPAVGRGLLPRELPDTPVPPRMGGPRESLQILTAEHHWQVVD